MKSNHSLSQRLVAYILLLSLFLQSCLNSPIPPATPKHTGQASTSPVSADKKDKNDTNLDLSNTISTSNENIEDQSNLSVSLLLRPPTNPSYVTDKDSQKSEPDLSREFPLQVSTSQKDTQPANNDYVPHPSPLHDDNHPIVHFVEQQPAHIDTSEQLKQARFKKDNLHTPYKQLATNQQLAKADSKVEKPEKEEKYEKESPSQVSPKKMDTSSPIKRSVSSELIEQISRQVFAATDDHLVTFEWEDGKCMALVEEPLSVGVGFTRNHTLAVYLLPGMTWEQVATMNELEQKYYIRVIWKNSDQESHVLIGKMGLMGGGRTPLHEAIETGEIGHTGYWPKYGDRWVKPDTGAMGILWEHPEYLSQQDGVGATPLHRAICCIIHPKLYNDISGFLLLGIFKIRSATRAELIENMVKEGAKIDAVDYQGCTPLHWAVNHMQGDGGDNTSSSGSRPNYPAIIRQLVKLGANINAKDKNGYAPLHRAVEKNNSYLVSFLIELEADQNIQDGNGNTPLHLAAEKDNIAMLEQLINLGANKDSRNHLGYTPLHLAAAGNKLTTVIKLKDKGANPHATDKNGNTPLHLAMEKGLLDPIKYLAQAGASLHHRNNLGLTAIDVASIKGRLDDVHQIFEISGININQRGNDGLTHLERAIQNKDLPLVKQLIQSKADVNLKNSAGKTPLHLAVEKEDLGIIQHLIASGANKQVTDNNGKTPVHLALQKCNSPFFKPIINALGINERDNNGYTLLFNAISDGNIELANRLIEAGADVKAKIRDNYTPLHEAACSSTGAGIVTKLITSGADKNAQDTLGDTPLHVAARQQRGGYCIAEKLIEASAEKNIKNKNGNTPLHEAANFGCIQIVQLLTNKGADKTTKNNNGETALHVALKKSSSSDFQQLLQALKINLHEKDSNGNTLLHQAAIDGDETLVRQLISLNLIDKNIKNSFGKSPLHLAIEKGNTRLTSVLIDLKVDKDIQDSSGNTPLHLAVQAGNATMLEQLINSGVNKDSRNNLGYTPLHLAVTCKQYALAVKLKEKGANLHSTDNKGNIPLHVAVETDYWELAKYLAQAQAGASLHHKNNSGLTPIELAANNGRLDNIRQIFEISGININLRGNDGLTHLERAVQRRNLLLIKQLTTSHADLNLKSSLGKTSLHLAIEQEDVATIQHLIASGANKHIADNSGITPFQLALQKANCPCFPQIVSVLDIDINEKDGNDQTLLHRTIEEGNLVLAKQLIQAGANIDIKDRYGNTLLHRAVLSGNKTVANQLLGMRADQNAKNNKQKTPLHLAAAKENIAIVEILLAAEADKNTKDKNGKSPLHVAVKHGNLPIIKKLIAAGANKDEKDKNDWTPLHTAVSDGYKEIVELLISSGANKDVGDIANWTPLHIAVFDDSEEIVNLLISSGANKEAKENSGRTPLHRAACRKCKPIAITLISSGANKEAKDNEGNTPLHLAAYRNKKEMVALLISSGANKNVANNQGNTPLHLAIQKGYLETAKCLVENGVDLHAQNGADLTPIDLLSEHRHLEFIRQIFAVQDTNINQTDINGLNHLHRAVKRKDLELVKLLLSLGANKNAIIKDHLRTGGMANVLHSVFGSKEEGTITLEDILNPTPLHWAVTQENIAIIRCLVDAGADKHIKNKQGKTPVQLALENENQELAKQLLHALGVVIHAKDENGSTPLHDAVKHNNLEMLKQFIGLGANKDTRNNEGMTPLQLAAEQNKLDILKYLLSLGADKNSKDNLGNTSLHTAMTTDDPIIAKHLIEDGADLHAKNNAVLTPIDLASQVNHLAYLKEIFLVKPTNINSIGADGLTHLHRAVQRNDKKLAKQLIAHGADVKATDQAGRTSLHDAAAQGHTKLLKHLSAALKPKGLRTLWFRGAPILIDLRDKQGCTALHLAAENGHIKTATFLLQQKAELYAKDNNGLTPIHHALAAQQIELIKGLLKIPGFSPLACAIENNDISLVKELVAAGVDINTINSAGKSVLYVAFEKGYMELIQELIELGAQVNATDSQGRSLLHHTVTNGQLPVTNALLAAGADVHLADKQGLTSLHLAAQHNQSEIAQQLIAHGAHVNARDKQQMTPLHCAAHHGHVTVGITLIRAGANLQAVDEKQNTPLTYALQNGHLSTVSLLAATNEYTIHLRRCTDSARRQVTLPKDLDNQSINKEEQQRMLDDFLAAHMGTLSTADQQKFLKNIVPILQKQLMRAPWKLQHKLINYFREDGNFYINILQNFDVQDWVKESLIMDIGQEGWANNNEILFTKFKESILPIVESYPDDQLEQLLFALKERQQMHQLSLLTICDIIRYLSVLEPQQALEHLELIDTAWLNSLRLAWLAKKTKQLHPTFSLSQCSQLSYALAQSTWSSDILERFITGLETETNFHYVAELVAFLAKTQPDPHILLMAFYKKSSPTMPSVARTWRHYIGCELLKNKLAHLFPIHTQALEARITKLLTNHWLYEEIDSTLEKLKTKSSNDANIEAYRLIDALDLLVEYTVKKSLCKQALVDILQKKPSEDWEKEIHPLVIAATFGASHERNVKEIIDYIAEKSPNTPFANDKEALEASYQAILAAYQKSATLLSTNKKPISQWGEAAVTEWAIQAKGSTALRTMSPATQAEVLAVVKRTVELTHKHSPRSTQLLALLVFLNHTSGKGRLAQINTGEGKSLIVAMLAAIHALQGKKVDVVTTSTELSIPEVKKQSKFFHLLGLTVGENSVDEQKKEVYTSDIVYGTAANFQGDILKTEFSGKDIRGTRGFGVVIVDEVDSMLFDSRHASIRLSSQTPAMHHLEMLLGAVYSQVSKTLRHLLEKDGQTYYINEDFEIQDGKIIFLNTNEEIQEASMEPIPDKEGFIKQVAQNHLESLLRPLYGEERKDWDDHKAHHAKIVKASIELECEEDEKKREEKAKKCEELAQQAEDLAWRKNNRSPVIEIPKHLETFAKKQIPNWAHSAIQAICFFKKELHYDVRDGRIVPIDYDNTGVLQDKMVWSDGLAQMLQIKEGLRVEPENISTNFISVPEFFKRYGNAIYGLTGTLGNEPTHHFLSEVYGADRVIMPPYKHIPIAGNEQSKYICKELPAIIVPTPKEWYEAICRTNLSKARNQRAVLIICKYIDQVKKIAKELSAHHDPTKIFTYTGQEEFNKEHIDGGEIIIATNIAGRGTDITTTPVVEQTGGLHVCITFLPDSYRVELQNAGRTARQGKQGTAQLIIHDHNNQTIEELKALRDSKEETAINHAKHDVKDMLFRDRLFSRFCALESEILPTTEHCDKEAQLRKLWIMFDRGYKKYLAPGGELDRIYEVEILKEAQSILYEQYKKQAASSPTAEIKELNSALKKLKIELSKKHDKEALIPQLKQQLVEKICALAKGKYANDVIEHFRNGRTALPTHPELAPQNDRKEINTMSPFCNRQDPLFMDAESKKKNKYDWGKHERSGIEETWGLWLQHAFKDKDAADEAAVWKSFDRLSDDIWRDAKNNSLIKNPYYYILKGNDLLFGQNTKKAITAYDRAIGLDKLHSVNAYYNKAKALLRPKENKDNISKARGCLEQAKIIIATHLKPNLISFNSVVASTGGSKPKLLEHLQHQLNILMKQESYIDTALKEISKAQKEDWNLELTELKPLKEVLKEEKGDHTPAITKANINGLQELFVLKATQPYPWKSIIALALLGVAQVVAGTLIWTCTGGTAGLGLISEGVSDLLACASAAISGTFSWAQWGIQKAISLAVAIVSSGFDGIKKAFQDLKKTAENIKNITFTTFKEGFKTAGSKAALELGKGAAKMLATKLLDAAVEKWGIQNMEQYIEKKVITYIDQV